MQHPFDAVDFSCEYLMANSFAGIDLAHEAIGETLKRGCLGSLPRDRHYASHAMRGEEARLRVPEDKNTYRVVSKKCPAVIMRVLAELLDVPRSRDDRADGFFHA